MLHEELINEIGILSQVTSRDLHSVKFTYERRFRHSEDQPFCEWCGKGWPQYMPDMESGLYFLRWPKDKVVYIGKATKDNLGAEIWGKFGKPEEEGGRKIFSNSYFLSNLSPDLKKNPDLQSAIRHGEIFITTITVDKPEVASFIEVYLQTVASDKEKWPCLNKRIG